MTTKNRRKKGGAAPIATFEDSHIASRGWTAQTLEQRIEARLRALFADLPRMAHWLMLAVAVALLLAVVHRGAAIGSLAVMLLNMAAAGYVGYWFSRALERGRRPHALFEQAAQLRSGGGLESVAVRLELEANRILNRRFALISACVVGATFMKF